MNEAEWLTRKQRIDVKLRSLNRAWQIIPWKDGLDPRAPMLGRGTRLCPDINKSKFVVFDCFDGTLIQYFKNVSRFDIEPRGPAHVADLHKLVSELNEAVAA